MKRYRFYSDCVSWPRDDVPALSDMVHSARLISRRTFLRHVDQRDREDLERELGYGRWPDLSMARDVHVSYHRSTLHGQAVYFVTWSAIEYVFTLPQPTGKEV